MLAAGKGRQARERRRTSPKVTLALTHAPRQRSQVLALARDGRVGRVVLGHVAGAAAAGGVGGGFDGRGDEVGGVVDGFFGDVAFFFPTRGEESVYLLLEGAGLGGGEKEGERGREESGKVGTGAAAAVGDAR